MYNAHPSALALASLSAAHGVYRWVLCPGSRNVPIIHNIAANAENAVYRLVDERSAAFFALGLAEATGSPVGLCCTSGSALFNVASAVSEAYYRAIPLLIVSADRPIDRIDRMHDQTLRQNGLLDAVVRFSATLPEGRDPAAEALRIDLLNEAFIRLQQPAIGPVHVNIPFSEPLTDFTAIDLPGCRSIRRVPLLPGYGASGDIYRAIWQTAQRKLILVGQLNGTEAEALAPLLDRLTKQEDCILLAEHLANLGGTLCAYPLFDELLYSLDTEQSIALAPDLLLTIGRHILSKRVKQWLELYPAKQHWSFSPDGTLYDTFRSLTDVFPESGTIFIREILESAYPGKDGGCRSKPEKHPYQTAFAKTYAGIKPFSPTPTKVFSDLDVLGTLLAVLPQGCVIAAGNSSTVRNLQHFILPDGSYVTCNRGVSGIDGCLSSAVGFAAGTERPVYCILGDLSFFYDMNVLWRDHLPTNLKIILMNNAGGQIFHTIPGMRCSSYLGDYIAHDNKYPAAEGWARSVGLTYVAVRTYGDIPQASRVLRAPGAAFVEVFTEINRNVSRLSDYYHAAGNQS